MGMPSLLIHSSAIVGSAGFGLGVLGLFRYPPSWWKEIPVAGYLVAVTRASVNVVMVVSFIIGG
jgi:hypothetical protein